MRTKKQYTNFELVAQWKHLQSGGNSGIFVWAGPEMIDSRPEISQNHRSASSRPWLYEQYEKRGKKAEWFTTNGDLFPVEVFR